MWFNNETFGVNTSLVTAGLNTTLLPVMVENNAELNYFGEIQFVITAVLFTLGLFGNTSVILVLRRLKSAASVLTIYMAIFDTLGLMSKVLVDGVLNYHRGNFGYLFCVTMHLPMEVFVPTANWTLVLICIERFISMYFPFSYRSIISVRRVHLAVATILCIFVICGVVVTTQMHIDSSNQCEVVSIFLSTYEIIRLVITSVGPCLMTTIFTSLVIVKIKFSRSKIRHVEKSNIRQKLESSLSRLMLSSAILFTLLNLPGTFYFCVIWPTLDHKDLNTVPVLDISFTLLMDLSHILNFVAYLTCVEPFRNSFRQLFIRRSEG